jgi:hypothetical protein
LGLFAARLPLHLPACRLPGLCQDLRQIAAAVMRGGRRIFYLLAVGGKKLTRQILERKASFSFFVVIALSLFCFVHDVFIVIAQLRNSSAMATTHR